MKPPNHTRALVVFLAVMGAAVALALLREDPRVCVPIPGGAGITPAAAGERATRSSADSRQASARLAPARLRPAGASSTRVSSVRRGIRAAVTSPRVALEDGSPGVVPNRWEAQVYALVPSRERGTVDRIGIAREGSPATARGDFAIDLPTGSYLVVVQHRVARAGREEILEAWYAYAEVASSDPGLVDLGRHQFAAATIEGVVRGPGGGPVEAARVDLSDETKRRGDGLVRGVLLSATTGADGGFSFSLARGDGQEVVCRVSASSGDAVARREGVRGGEVVELTLPAKPPRAEVTFEVPWSADTRLWVYSRVRAGAFMCELGRRPATGVVEERRSIEPGTYVVELFRRSGPDSHEWARLEVDLSNPGPIRARIDPVFEAARSIAGRTRPGVRVDWVTRLDDGSRLIRDSTKADTTGRFILRGVPTTETLLATGSILTPVPPGSEALYEIGELRSG